MTIVLSRPDQISFFRLITTIQAIQMHLKYNGEFRLTRMATPKNLRTIASEFTGKAYTRSTKGLTEALADLVELKASLIS
jgi:hypothetical protein